MENKFEIGDLVRVKSGLTEDETGISIEELKELNGINRIIRIDENDDGYCYLVTNLSLTTHYWFSEEQLEPVEIKTEETSISLDNSVKEQIIKEVKLFLEQLDQPKPLDVKVKYHDAEMPKFEQIEKGNWIDCRVIKGGKVTHSDGTKEPLEWKLDKNGQYYIEYKAGDFMMLPLGFSINQGKGYEINLVPRSSTFKNYGIIQTNHFAVGDDTFVGNNDMYHYPCYALRDGRINLYDRVCQMRINKAMPKVIFNEVEDMESEDRGGFGTTGTK